jgi:hypothetical protein
VTEQVVLGGANRTVTAVVDHKNLDRQMMIDQSLQFLNVHLNATVACEADHPFATACDCGADGRGQIVAHRSGTRVGDETLPVAKPPDLVGHDERAAVSADDDIVIRQLVKERLKEVIRIDRRGLDTVMLLDRWIPVHALKAPRAPNRRMGGPRNRPQRFDATTR